MTILINPQTRLLAASTLLLITLLCCPSSPELTTPSAELGLAPTATWVPAVSTAIPTLSTPTPLPAHILALGEWAAWDNFSVSVESYEVVDRCPGEGPGPAEGAKLLYVWIAMRNHGDKVVGCPVSHVYIRYGGVSAASAGGTVCRHDDQSLGNACYDRMYPGVDCRGWVLFEIPLAHQVANTLVEIQEGPSLGPITVWRLAGGPGE